MDDIKLSFSASRLDFLDVKYFTLYYAFIEGPVEKLENKIGDEITIHLLSLFGQENIEDLLCLQCMP